MNKNLKRVLSYALGIVLAMGLGLTYAYAVGANDSNAFVTKTEWAAKVAQIEASLDNVNKTIDDSNMDFVMNGPRLQAGLIDGFENISTIGTHGDPFSQITRYSTLAHYYNRFSVYSRTMLSDHWDGRQGVETVYAGAASDYNQQGYICNARYALQSTDPNIYLIISVYHMDVGSTGNANLVQVCWVDISKKIQDYSVAKNITVILPESEWGHYGATNASYSRNNGHIGNTSCEFFPPMLLYHNTTSTAIYPLTTTGYGQTKTVADGKITILMEFQAGYPIFRTAVNQSASFGIFPYNMNGRKMGNAFDSIMIKYSTSSQGYVDGIAKIYCPTKGCLCLKNFLNGEIPILNE